jgi:4-hydroxy-4-methyl-2-oxoglutarate aldolase
MGGGEFVLWRRRNLTLSREVLQKLASFDTPTICNIIELFGIRPRNTGFMDGHIRAIFPEMKPAVGYAATATFRSANPPQGMDIYSALENQVAKFAELSGPAFVVFQDLDFPPNGATVGEIMCTSYQTFGSVGLVTSGGVRDVDQVKKIGYPMFANSIICAHANCHILHLHIPVHVGGITINADDLLHADCNGVTTVPVEIAADIADVGDEYVAAEMIVLEALHTFGANMQQFQLARIESKVKMESLRMRVTRKV